MKTAIVKFGDNLFCEWNTATGQPSTLIMPRAALTQHIMERDYSNQDLDPHHRKRFEQALEGEIAVASANNSSSATHSKETLLEGLRVARGGAERMTDAQMVRFYGAPGTAPAKQARTRPAKIRGSGRAATPRPR
jgi:hypothetical protein